MPVFESYPFSFAMRGGCGRFLSGAFRRLSSSDGSILARFRLSVKKLQQKVSHKGGAGAYRVGSWLTSVVAGPFRGSPRYFTRKGGKLAVV